ncbi:hypothetical protein [Endozoicomonas arenosclerae]|uniref:hypothetical protein n=1 Tax=Endozoicomonas arenosclerae TaxID=1633495 RepID=UPI000780F309|nr:hypothetical protein [Endozoicomonas arenosclerae]
MAALKDGPDLFDTLSMFGHTLADGANKILGAGLDSVAERISPDYIPGEQPPPVKNIDNDGSNLAREQPQQVMPGFQMSTPMKVGAVLMVATVGYLLLRK